MRRTAFWLTFGSAVAVIFSIAVCHILLALALAALLVSGERLRLPPVGWPLGLFVLGTLISLALSQDAAAGRPQIRKFFVFVILLVVYSTFREVGQARWLVLTWAGAGTLSALRSLFQFWQKLEESRQMGVDFYAHYIAERTTGFMSHWMTFGGQMMVVLLLLASFLLFARHSRRGLWLWLAAVVVALALVAGFTRSIWLATGAGLVYLAWGRNRWVVLAAPLVVALGIWIGPRSLRQRFTSIVRPKIEVDSNEHRVVTWRTGWRMIQAHPWFGLGPEMVKRRFDEFVPPDVPRPLPSGWYGHLHNIYLHYAAERGLPTLAALLWMLGKMLADFARALRRAPPGRGDAKFLLMGAIAVLLAILIEGFFELNLGDSEVLFMFLGVAACGYVARDSLEPAESPRS